MAGKIEYEDENNDKGELTGVFSGHYLVCLPWDNALRVAYSVTWP
jgi:hypothetical protein